MTRTLLVPPALTPAALAELKAWLAIGTSGEDAALSALLRASLDVCEAFTGQMPLEATCEERLPASSAWQYLATRPVLAVTGVDGIAADGARTALPAEAYAVDLDADGGARVRLVRPEPAVRVAVRFTAGIAGEWAELPEALRHGVVRLAAHLYREREQAAPASPPAAVAALWRPWRRMRLA